MNSDSGKEQADKKVIHLDVDERLPAVQGSSPAAEVVKQIIEQILINERQRARMEFVRIASLFLIFILAIFGSGIWFARQLLAQLREERHLMEQSWQMLSGQVDGARQSYPALKSRQNYTPALDHETVAKLEQNIKAVSDLLKTKPRDSSASVRDMLQSQQTAIQALSARLNEAQDKVAATESGGKADQAEARQIDSIPAPVSEDLKLRMPIPSL